MFKVLSILVQVLVVAMSKLLIVNFNTVEMESIRHTFSDEGPKTVSEVVDWLQNKYGTAQRIEYYCPIMGNYIDVVNKLENIEIFSRPYLSVLLTFPTTAEIRLIKGRQFTLLDGLININGINVDIGEISNDSRGTGLNLWDGAVVLAKYFEHNPGMLQSKNIIELGAGTGLAGFAAHVMGAGYTLMTDLAYALPNLQSNLDNLAKGVASAGQRMDVAELDWSDSSTYVKPVILADGSISFAISGSKSVSELDVAAEMSEWDFVIGADIVWIDSLVPPLVKALSCLCGTRTVLLLSHQKRTEQTDLLLFGLLEEFFIVEQIAAERHHPLYSSSIINIFKCVKKP